MPDQFKADFNSLILSIASSAAMSLGLAPDQDSGQIRVDKNMAKFNIDLLVMLQEKTKNNLSDDEAKLMERVLFEIRTKYVEVSKVK